VEGDADLGVHQVAARAGVGGADVRVHVVDDYRLGVDVDLVLEEVPIRPLRERPLAADPLQRREDAEAAAERRREPVEVAVSDCAGSTRTMAPPSLLAAMAMLPRMRKASPPNIFFSLSSGSLPMGWRMRPASAWS
jgi:hypothetical protein